MVIEVGSHDDIQWSGVHMGPRQCPRFTCVTPVPCIQDDFIKYIIRTTLVCKYVCKMFPWLRDVKGHPRKPELEESADVSVDVPVCVFTAALSILHIYALESA